MNHETSFRFPSTDTVLNVLTIGGVALTLAVLTTTQGLQGVLA